MRETAHRFERNGGNGALDSRRNVENIAVPFLVTLRNARGYFFAAQPAAVAIRKSARAVDDRPAERDELSRETLLARIEIDRHAAAHAFGVVREVSWRA